MKIFDWELAYKMGSSKEKIDWLKANHKKPITQDEFVAAMIGLKGSSNSKRKGKQHSPSALKSRYRLLKKSYGFFQ